MTQEIKIKIFFEKSRKTINSILLKLECIFIIFLLFLFLLSPNIPLLFSLKQPAILPSNLHHHCFSWCRWPAQSVTLPVRTSSSVSQHGSTSCQPSHATSFLHQARMPPPFFLSFDHFIGHARPPTNSLNHQLLKNIIFFSFSRGPKPRD